jgi:methylenetetrahydrofolate reductase (NADPH)
MVGRISQESDLVSPPGFLIGTYVSAFAPASDWGADRIGKSIDTGAGFLQTQPCLNIGVLRKYAQKLVELRITHRAALMVEIPLLHSTEMAREYKSRYPSALIPDSAIDRMSMANNELEAGIALCKEMLADVRATPGVAGACIRYEGPAALVSAISAAAGTG